MVSSGSLLSNFIVFVLYNSIIFVSTWNMIHSQHDGAPAHFAVNVKEYLNEQFRQRWIGRGGPVPWPARSPDLTPMNFLSSGVT